MKKHFLLFGSILLAFIGDLIAQCTPPSNQPTNIQPTESQTSVKIDFTPAPTGLTPADGYLVLLIKNPPFTGGTPNNGTNYQVGNKIGNGEVVFYGAGTSITVNNLTANTDYTFLVFSASMANHCFNSTNPLTQAVKTKAGTNSVTSSQAGGQDKGASSVLSPLLNFNFTGSDNSWSNLTPIIFYGWSESGKASKGKGVNNKKLWTNTFQLGPYIGSQISIKDSGSYLPAIMLPGNAGLQMNYYMTLFNEEKISVIISPLNLGLKVISGFTDSTISVIQHSIRHMIGLNYSDKFNISVQYTQGWHNSIPNSKDNFGKLFKTTDTKVAYWNVGLTTKLSKDLFGQAGGKEQPLYLALNWRTLSKPSNNFNLPNYRFFTIGLIANLDLKSGSHPGAAPKAPPF
jgi:hypothetical protein